MPSPPSCPNWPGGNVSTSHVERAAEALGREIAEDEIVVELPAPASVRDERGQFRLLAAE